jgi:hypothetical protein
VTLWNREKSQYDIQQSMIQDPQRDGLLHDWNFNDPQTHIVYNRDIKPMQGADLEKAYKGNVRFIAYANDLIDLTLDLTQKQLYTCSRQRTIVARNLTGAEERTLYQRNNAIHTLAVDPINERLYWIEGNGELWRGDLNGNSPNQLDSQLPTGIGGQWQLTIDPKRQTLYWTNGREIWAGIVANNLNSLQQKAIFIPNAESPAPFDLDYDSSSNRLFWLDQALQRLRSAASLNDIQDLYATPNVRRGLAIDDELKQLYWNSEYSKQLEGAAVDKPGQLPGKPYLMRGDVYGNKAAEPLFPLAIEGGLALASKSEASHEQRISAYRQRLTAQKDAQAKLLQARAEAHALVQQAHQDNEAKHAQAQQAVNNAQADASRRRAAAQQKRQAAPGQANQIRSNAQQTAEQHKAQAKQQADGIKQKAQDQKKQIVNDANSDLAAAKAEKAKYKS